MQAIGNLQSLLTENRAIQEAEPTTCPTSSYNCQVCRDTGWEWVGPRTVTRCACQAVKQARLNIERSGLQHALNTLTFGAYKAVEPWQKNALNTAKAWLNETLKGSNGAKPWLFMGGAVGSGKTHLCTAACGELLKGNRAVRYMLWSEDSRALKASVNDLEEFERIIRPLETVDVLYIDDLFKVQRNRQQTNLRGETFRPSIKELVTPADIRVAFELLDARYRMNRPTIISCEWLMDELMQMDEGVFSRVYERTEGYRSQIGRVGNRNFRMHDKQ